MKYFLNMYRNFDTEYGESNFRYFKGNYLIILNGLQSKQICVF